MATLTISATYQPDFDPMNVPLDGKLTIVVPSSGCTICLQTNLGGQNKYDLSANKTIDLKNHPASTVLYDIFALNNGCPDRAKRNAHTIQIGSGMPSS